MKFKLLLPTFHHLHRAIGSVVEPLSSIRASAVGAAALLARASSQLGLNTSGITEWKLLKLGVRAATNSFRFCLVTDQTHHSNQSPAAERSSEPSFLLFLSLSFSIGIFWIKMTHQSSELSGKINIYNYVTVSAAELLAGWERLGNPGNLQEQNKMSFGHFVLKFCANKKQTL